MKLPADKFETMKLIVALAATAAALIAAAATAAGAGAGAPASTHGARLRRRPREDVNAVYGHTSSPRSFEAAVEELVSGVARPSAMELAYAAAKQALFDLAGRRPC